MKFIFLMLLMVSTNIWGQAQSQLRIIDRVTSKPISYVTIYVGDKILLSDTMGLCVIGKGNESEKINISCLGYKDTSVFINPKNLGLIRLTPKVILLPELNISSKKGKTQKLGISKKTRSTLSMPNNSIMAVFIPNESSSKKLIKKVILPFKSNDNESHCFRIHLFDRSSDGSPNRNLIEKNIVIQTNKKKGTLEFDITEFYISIPQDGIFVGIEWLELKNADVKKAITTKNDKLQVFLNKKSGNKYHLWEKSKRTRFLWSSFSVGSGNDLSINLGLVIEEF